MTLPFTGGVFLAGVVCVAWISATLRAPQAMAPLPQPLLFEQPQQATQQPLCALPTSGRLQRFNV